jgi:starch-binding outer membrane protein, SusD/RagB family
MRKRAIWCVAAAVVLAACDSPLDTDPTASIDSETALTTPRGIQLGLNGAYRALQSGNLWGNVHVVYPDLYADNLDFTGTFQTDREVGNRNVSSSNGQVLSSWSAAYAGINRANNLLDAIPSVTELTAAQQAQYRGEALFIRALMYYYLVSWHGDVPLVLDPSRGVDDSSLVSRSPAADVYARIIADLEEAATLLTPARNPGRATQGAANALLARVHLDAGNHAEARDRATAVINNTAYAIVPNYGSIWTTKNSAESIFELPYSINNSNSLAFWFFPDTEGGRLGFAPTSEFYNAFEAGDERRDFYIRFDEDGQIFGAKYFRVENGDDNVVVLRLAEMYLIRAEANARLNAPAQTVRDDIDVVRNRAGLADLPATVDTQEELLDAVLEERRFELAFEGHRFFDLRRRDPVAAAAYLDIPSDRLLFPIPQSERDVNPNLTQNPGY